MKEHKQLVKNAKEQSELRALKRKIYLPLIQDNQTPSSLKDTITYSEFKELNDDKRNPCLEMKNFVKCIAEQLDDGKLLERSIWSLAEYFKDSRKPTMVNVKKFNEDFNTFYEFFKMTSYIFGKLDEIKHKRKESSIQSIL